MRTATPASGSPAPDLRAGVVLGGRYRLMTPLSLAGPQRTWLAEQLVLGRTVRVKVVDLQAPQAGQALDRLRREAAALAACTHPDVARICELGQDERHAWLGMEYVPGSTLGEVLAAGPMAPGRLLHVLRQLCALLEDLAGQGLHLGGVDPATVVLTERGRDPDHLRLGDLSAALTEPPDPQEAMAGRVRAVGELMHRGLTGRPAPAAPASMALDGALPPCLEWTCLACLAPAPARMPDLASLERALAACAEALAAPEGVDLRLRLVNGALVRIDGPSRSLPPAAAPPAPAQGWLVPTVLAVVLLGVAVAAVLDHELSAGARPSAPAVVSEAAVAGGRAE